MHRNAQTPQSRQAKTKAKFARATILTICTLWLTSCITTPKTDNSARAKFYPPDPYNADGSLVWEYDADRDAVIVPYWYWEKIFDYIADTQAEQK